MRGGLVWRGALRQGGEGGAEHPAVIALLGEDEVFRNDVGAIRAAGAQTQGVPENAGYAAGAEAAEAQFMGHQKGLGQDPAQGGAHQFRFAPAVHLLKGRIEGENHALVVGKHKRGVAVLKRSDGGGVFRHGARGDRQHSVSYNASHFGLRSGHVLSRTSDLEGCDQSHGFP